MNKNNNNNNNKTPFWIEVQVYQSLNDVDTFEDSTTSARAICFRILKMCSSKKMGGVWVSSPYYTIKKKNNNTHTTTTTTMYTTTTARKKGTNMKYILDFTLM